MSLLPLANPTLPLSVVQEVQGQHLSPEAEYSKGKASSQRGFQRQEVIISFHVSCTFVSELFDRLYDFFLLYKRVHYYYYYYHYYYYCPSVFFFQCSSSL